MQIGVRSRKSMPIYFHFFCEGRVRSFSERKDNRTRESLNRGLRLLLGKEKEESSGNK